MEAPKNRRHGSPPAARRATGMEWASERAPETSATVRCALEASQFRRLLVGQAEMAARGVADELRRLGEESLALAHGRPQDGPAVVDYLRQVGDALLAAAGRADALADDVLEHRGVGDLLEDLQDFGRRRPVLFVLAAAAAGAAAGWAVQTSSAPSQLVAGREQGRGLVALSPEALDAVARRLWPGGSELPPGRRGNV